jgi:uncharacterized membrane protein
MLVPMATATESDTRNPSVPAALEATDDTSPAPYFLPPPEGPQKTIGNLGPGAPFQWLAAGWHDLYAHKGIALFYGICFWSMAVVLALVFRSKPEYVMSIASGCLLVGPFLAMGLYEVSRRREAGLKPDLASSLTCWDTRLRSVGLLVLVLIVLELIWGRASLVVFAVFFNTGMPSTTGVVNAVFNPQNWEFVAIYLAVGGAFAGLVYAISVVSIPMILDRDTDAISAAITSLQVVVENPGVLLLWGALITVLVALALLPWGLGLVVVGPWLGHASWHAYRGSVSWQTDEAPLPNETAPGTPA